MTDTYEALQKRMERCVTHLEDQARRASALYALGEALAFQHGANLIKEALDPREDEEDLTWK